MRNERFYGAVLAALLALSACTQKSGLDIAAKNINIAGTRSIEFTGTGMWGMPGQMFNTSSPWMLLPVSSYRMTVDYTTGTSHVAMTRTEPSDADNVPNTAFRKQYFDFFGPNDDEYYSGNAAWDVAKATDPPAARPDAVAERAADAHLTPHGFIKLALESKAPYRKTSDGGDTTFQVGHQKFYGRFNAQGDLEPAQTWIDNPHPIRQG